MIQEVLLPGEALPTCRADHPPILLQVGGSCPCGVIGVATQVAPESSEAGVVVAAHRALIYLSIILIILVIVPHSLASTLGVLSLAAAFL